MPYFEELSCAGCGYGSGPLVHTPYRHPAVCRECREIVLAEQDPFCPFDAFCCPRCRQTFDSPADLPEKISSCPKCGHDTVCKGGFVSRHPSAVPREGQRVQFRRIGRQNERGAGLLRGMPFELFGELSQQPGLWWGEGRLAGDDQIEVTSKLRDDPRSNLERFDVADSKTEQPWLRVDFASLRAGLEGRADVYRLPLTVWSNWSPPFGDLQHHTLKIARPRPAQASEIAATVLTLRPEVHCLAEIYDGREWVPFRETRWVVKMSSDEILEATAGAPLHTRRWGTITMTARPSGSTSFRESGDCCDRANLTARFSRILCETTRLSDWEMSLFSLTVAGRWAPTAVGLVPTGERNSVRHSTLTPPETPTLVPSPAAYERNRVFPNGSELGALWNPKLQWPSR